MGKISRWFSTLLRGKKRWAFVKSFHNHRPPPPQQLPAAAAAEIKVEEGAAVKIQAAFRGYLARRALRALKGLVKLQALVRGNIVRKQAAETLRCMKALVRVQAQACAYRALQSKPSSSSKSSHSNPGPATPEKYEATIRSIASKRNSLKQTGGMDDVDRKRNHSANCNWLYQGMEERYWNMIEASKFIDDEKIDNEKPMFYSKRKSSLCHLQSSCCSMKSNQSAGSLATEPNSLSKDSTATLLSTPSPSPADRHRSMTPLLRFPSVDFGESPRYYSSASRPGSSRRGPFTPVKSECSPSFFKGYSNYPNYMANTVSSTAKLRSHSAPKQRPECEKLNSLRRLSAQRLSDQATAAAGPIFSKFENVAYSGSGRLDRLGMPMRI